MEALFQAKGPSVSCRRAWGAHACAALGDMAGVYMVAQERAAHTKPGNIPPALRGHLSKGTAWK